MLSKYIDALVNFFEFLDERLEWDDEELGQLVSHLTRIRELSDATKIPAPFTLKLLTPEEFPPQKKPRLKKEASERRARLIGNADRLTVLWSWLKKTHPGHEADTFHIAGLIDRFPVLTNEQITDAVDALSPQIQTRNPAPDPEGTVAKNIIAMMAKGRAPFDESDYEMAEAGPIEIPNAKSMVLVECAAHRGRDFPPCRAWVTFTDGTHRGEVMPAETREGLMINTYKSLCDAMRAEAQTEDSEQDDVSPLIPSTVNERISRADDLVKLLREQQVEVDITHDRILERVKSRDPVDGKDFYSLVNARLAVSSLRAAQANADISKLSREFRAIIKALTPVALNAGFTEWDSVLRLATWQFLATLHPENSPLDLLDSVATILFKFSIVVEVSTDGWPTVQAVADELDVTRQAIYDAGKEVKGQAGKLRIVDGKVDPKTLPNYQPAKKGGRSGKKSSDSDAGPLKEWECGNCGQSCDPAARKPKKCKTCPSTDIREVLDK